jgi:hypothetical protein
MQHSRIENTDMMHKDLPDREMSIILATSDIECDYAFLRDNLQSSGWNLIIAETVLDTRSIAMKQPISLVLLDLADTTVIAPERALALRSIAAPSAAAPILALSSSAHEIDPISIHVDAIINRAISSDSLVQQLQQWRPVSLEPTRRIAEMFGPGPIAGMIERLARRLEPALANLAHGVFDRSEAHRLAGLCGTLGFGQAHAAWLDLSLGDESVLSDVRRATRLVLSAVARGL